MRRRMAVCLGVALFLAGCGADSGLAPGTGTVTLDGAPLGAATLIFMPAGETKGQGGTAVSGADGKFAVKGPKGSPGLAPGTYRVVISKMLRPDGSPPPPDVPPIESDARETLPGKYSDSTHTTLTARVEPDGKAIDFALQSGKKR